MKISSYNNVYLGMIFNLELRIKNKNFIKNQI